MQQNKLFWILSRTTIQIGESWFGTHKMFGSAARNPPCFLPNWARFGGPFFLLRARAEQLFWQRRPAAASPLRAAQQLEVGTSGHRGFR